MQSKLQNNSKNMTNILIKIVTLRRDLASLALQKCSLQIQGRKQQSYHHNNDSDTQSGYKK